jgi:hypothetical protein
MKPLFRLSAEPMAFATVWLTASPFFQVTVVP